MDRQGFENSGVTAGLPTPQRTTGISGTDPTLGDSGIERNTGMTGTDTGYGTTGISPTGHTAGTVTDSGMGRDAITESRETVGTNVYVPVVPVEVGDRDETRGHTEAHHGRHDGEKKPMGEKVKEMIPGTQAHKEHKAEKEFEKGRYAD